MFFIIKNKVHIDIEFQVFENFCFSYLSETFAPIISTTARAGERPSSAKLFEF